MTYGKKIVVTQEVSYVGEGENPKDNIYFKTWEKILKECMSEQQQTASPELQAFFEKLLKLKQYCCISIAEAKTAPEMIAYQDVYKRLDDIIKDERTEVTHA